MDSLEFSLNKECEFIRISQALIDNCKPFYCGNDDLDNFFTQDAIAYDKDKMGKTYCWLLKEDDTKIVGFVTLANAGIQTTHLQNNPRRKINHHIARNKQGRSYPAVLIGRLAVNSDFQGSNYMIGKQIMDFIKSWFSEDDNKTGCRFILVDAVNNEHTVKYYARNGFKPLFPKIENEKEFYHISQEEELHTRMYYFDLL